MPCIPETLKVALTEDGLFVVKLQTGESFTFRSARISGQDEAFVRLDGVKQFLESGTFDDPFYAHGLEVRIDSIVWMVRRK